MRSGDLILVLLVAMLGTGIVAIQSAGLSVTDDLSLWGTMTNRVVLLAAGAMIAFFAGAFVPPRLLARPWVAWTALSLALILTIIV